MRIRHVNPICAFKETLYKNNYPMGIKAPPFTVSIRLRFGGEVCHADIITSRPWLSCVFPIEN